jgi:hypothetical protein
MAEIGGSMGQRNDKSSNEQKSKWFNIMKRQKGRFDCTSRGALAHAMKRIFLGGKMSLSMRV